MKNRNSFTEFVIVFFIITACITILEGILGVLFMPDMRFGYEAFFSPPLFGFLSALSGLVTKSSKELTMKQVLFREFLQLVLIEIMVFGLNYLCGTTFDMKLNMTLAISIALVFVVVYFVIWLNDQRSAKLFNEQLKAFQKEMQNNR